MVVLERNTHFSDTFQPVRWKSKAYFEHIPIELNVIKLTYDIQIHETMFFIKNWIKRKIFCTDSHLSFPI